MGLPENRLFNLLDVIGKRLSVNDFPINWLDFPNITSLEKHQNVHIDLIIMSFRDCFGRRNIPLTPSGQLVFELPVSGHITNCSAEYIIDDQTLVIIDVVKI